MPFDPATDYNSYVDGRPRADGVRTFLASRGITLPEGSPDDPPDAETVNGLGNRKNEILLRAASASGASSRTRARWPTCGPRGGRAAPGGRLGERQLPRRAGRRRPGPTCSRCGSTAWSRPSSGCAASRHPDTFLAAAASCSASAPGRRAVFEDALAGVEAGRAGGFGYVVGRRPGAATPTTLRGPRRRPSWSLTWPSCWMRRHDPRTRTTRSSRGASGRPGWTSTCWPSRSRCSRSPTATSDCAATSTRASRTGCPAPTSTPSTSCGRCPTPRPATAIPSPGQTIVNVTNGKLMRLLVDDEPFDVRYGELLSHERVLDLRAGTLRTRPCDWRSPAGQAVRVRSDPAGLVHPAVGRGHPLRGRAAGRAGPADPAVRAGRQRGRCPTDRARDPRVAAGAGVARWRPRSTDHDDRRRCWCTAPGAAGCGWPPAWTTWSTGPERTDGRAPRRTPDWARTTVACVLQPGQTLRVVKFLGVRLVGRSGPGRRCATRCTRRWPRPGFAGWDGLLPAQRAYLDEFWDARRRARSRATPRCSRRSGSGCSTCCRPAPGPSGGRSRPRA